MKCFKRWLLTYRWNRLCYWNIEYRYLIGKCAGYLYNSPEANRFRLEAELAQKQLHSIARKLKMDPGGAELPLRHSWRDRTYPEVPPWLLRVHGLR